jgi:hypothetical protein
LPLRGVKSRSLLHFLPFPRLHEEHAGEGAASRVPTTWAKLIPLGLVMSCVAHLAFLTPVVIFAGGSPFDPAPVNAITVDIVSPEEVPQPADEPAPAETTATEAATASPPAPPASPAVVPTAMPSSPPAPQPTRARPDLPATPQALGAPRSMLPPPPFVVPQPPQAKPPQLDDRGEQVDLAAGLFGMPLTMPDGSVGGRFSSQAVDPADVTSDTVTAFRDHLKTCSTLPAGVAPNVRVALRVHLNPDGALAEGLPQNPEPIRIEGVSVGGGALFQNAVAALRKCQPYRMLPPDRYQEWKTLDITFTPQNF